MMTIQVNLTAQCHEDYTTALTAHDDDNDGRNHRGISCSHHDDILTVELTTAHWQEGRTMTLTAHIMMTIQVNLTAHCHEDYTTALTAHDDDNDGRNHRGISCSHHDDILTVELT